MVKISNYRLLYARILRKGAVRAMIPANLIMSPIEVYLDGKYIGVSGAGSSEVRLPRSLEGTVEWEGNSSGFGQIILESDDRNETFQLKEVGKEASFNFSPPAGQKTYGRVVSKTQSRVVIRRI